MAVICGNDDFEGIEEFAQSKQPWLRSFLDLSHGVPTSDTFRRVFSWQNPEEFEACFISWMNSLAGRLEGKLIAIDGKTLRRSFEHAWKSHTAVHMVSTFVAANQQVFAQVAVEDQSNEIRAIPKLLDLLDLAGATVTLDAVGCQKQIARQIKACEYVLALKDNQPTLHAKAQVLLKEAVQSGGRGLILDCFEELDADHGCLERRKVWITLEIEHLRPAAQEFEVLFLFSGVVGGMRE